MIQCDWGKDSEHNQCEKEAQGLISWTVEQSRMEWKLCEYHAEIILQGSYNTKLEDLI